MRADSTKEFLTFSLFLFRGKVFLYSSSSLLGTPRPLRVSGFQKQSGNAQRQQQSPTPYISFRRHRSRVSFPGHSAAICVTACIVVEADTTTMLCLCEFVRESRVWSPGLPQSHGPWSGSGNITGSRKEQARRLTWAARLLQSCRAGSEPEVSAGGHSRAGFPKSQLRKVQQKMYAVLPLPRSPSFVQSFEKLSRRP